MNTVAPRFRFFGLFVTSNFVNDVGIGFSWFGHYFLEGFLLIYLPFSLPIVWKKILQSLIFVCFPSFSANPRRHAFYLGIRMILVHAPFSKTLICHEKQFLKLSERRSVFQHRFHYFFGIDFCIDLFIDFRWTNGSKMESEIFQESICLRPPSA